MIFQHRSRFIYLLFMLCLTACGSSTANSGTANSGGSLSGSSPVSVSTPQPTPVTSTSPTLDAEEASFFTLLNTLRTQNGVGQLQLSVDLNLSSQWMSQDMASKNYFSHTDSLGRDPFTRMAAFGFSSTYMGENIAAGSETGLDTYNQWVNSAPHLANMIDADYTWVGVGRAYSASSEYGWYWTTDFGSN
jgi:uncharacterized protein YkwD